MGEWKYPGVVDLGPDVLPGVIRHAHLGLSWTVVAVLENWTTRRYHDAVGTHAETRRFSVRVAGPLPGDPSAEGEFVMVVRRHGDRPRWWISPTTLRRDYSEQRGGRPTAREGASN
jgi:hypothetical protein